MIRRILIILNLFLWANITYSQAVMDMSFSQDTIVVGTPVELTLKMTSREKIPLKGIDISSLMKPTTLFSFINEADSLGNYESPDMEILDYGLFNNNSNAAFISNDQIQWESNGSGSNVATNVFRVTFWDPGVYQLVQPKYVFANARDSMRQVLNQPPVIFVNIPEGMEEQEVPLMPIKTILKEGKTWEDYKTLLYALAALFIGVLLFFISRKFKKLEEEVEEVPEVIIPAHIVALDKLKSLREAALWQKGQIKEYQSRLTYIIREYLENRFEINALESTTNEIKEELSKTDFDREHEKNLVEILQIADLVKFAKANPPEDLNSKFLNNAEDFVEKTKVKIIEPNQENESGAV